jgi:glucose dehydrogenase
MAAYDVVIVGSGFAGSFMAYQLGMQGKKVLILEAGPGITKNREDYMENFYLNTFKAPESPYPPNANALNPGRTNAPRPTIPELVLAWDNTTKSINPEKSYLTYAPGSGSLPFASTYEKVSGGTGNHWMGTSLRMLPNDLKTQTLYNVGRDWPPNYYDALEVHYGTAEAFIGVSGDKAQEEAIGIPFPPGYQYPMPGIPRSLVDQTFAAKVDGPPLTNESYAINRTFVTQTPAGRNSVPYDNRRVCHGNTNCTPICPIQAKYDATFGLNKALSTGNVDIIYKAVVDKVYVSSNVVTGLHYVTYDDISVPAQGGKTGEGTVVGTLYVLAAHAIENAKILLSSPWNGTTVANSSDQVGRNLMDHPCYLAWGMTPGPIYGYRGPISTAGIESLRDGNFRSQRASWRIEIGNEGWNWPTADPYTTGQDLIYGTNNGGLNPNKQIMSNTAYWTYANQQFTRQVRVAFLVEQPADPNNRVQLSTQYKDNLGIPRPLVTYNLSNYVRYGFQQARAATQQIMSRLGATEHTTTNPNTGTYFTFNGQGYNYAGAGHVCGTHVMGTNPGNSVVDRNQRSWDHDNLYLVGCGSMPSIGAENPTLTMMAMASITVDAILGRLGGGAPRRQH